MVSKSKISFILFLCIISLISVGFSSWVITVPAEPGIVSGAVDADDEFIDNGKDLFISLDDDYEIFNYGKNGFVDANGHDVRTGKISLNFTIDLDEYSKVNSKNSLTIDVKLSHNDCGVNLFKDSYGYISVKHSIIYTSPANVVTDYSNITADISVANQYGLSFVINNIDTTGIGKLSIVYQWTISSDVDDKYYEYEKENKNVNGENIVTGNTGYFYKEIYPKIFDEKEGKNKLQFTVDAKVES